MRAPLLHSSGVRDLKAYQKKKHRLKKTKTVGVIVEHFTELIAWARDHWLPEHQQDVQPFITYAVPVDFN